MTSMASLGRPLLQHSITTTLHSCSPRFQTPSKLPCVLRCLITPVLSLLLISISSQFQMTHRRVRWSQIIPSSQASSSWVSSFLTSWASVLSRSAYLWCDTGIMWSALHSEVTQGTNSDQAVDLPNTLLLLLLECFYPLHFPLKTTGGELHLFICLTFLID